MRELSVYWWKGSERVLIGRLGEAARSPIVFEWDKAFLRSAVELSPLNFKKVENLIECKREPFNGLPGLFADCVPDGWGKIILRIGLSETEIQGAEISALDALAYIGDSGMGALSFEPALERMGRREDLAWSARARSWSNPRRDSQCSHRRVSGKRCISKRYAPKDPVKRERGKVLFFRE